MMKRRDFFKGFMGLLLTSAVVKTVKKEEQRDVAPIMRELAEKGFSKMVSPDVLISPPSLSRRENIYWDADFILQEKNLLKAFGPLKINEVNLSPPLRGSSSPPRSVR